MVKEQRSSKWTFLFYKESAPADYLEVLEELHIPFILSPWHDKDINRQIENNSDDFMHEVVDIIEQNDFTEFEELVWYARANHTPLLGLIIERTYFFAKYLDSRRYNPMRNQDKKEDNKCK